VLRRHICGQSKLGSPHQHLCFENRFFAKRKTVTANAKKIVQHDNDREKTKKYESIKNRMTDQPEQSTIGKGEQNEKVLFFTEPHFLFLIPDAHLAHCLLS